MPPAKAGQVPAGTSFIKQFDEGFFKGTVKYWNPEISHYRITYEDGDLEDMKEAVLQRLLRAAESSANGSHAGSASCELQLQDEDACDTPHDDDPIKTTGQAPPTQREGSTGKPADGPADRLQRLQRLPRWPQLQVKGPGGDFRLARVVEQLPDAVLVHYHDGHMERICLAEDDEFKRIKLPPPRKAQPLGLVKKRNEECNARERVPTPPPSLKPNGHAAPEDKADLKLGKRKKPPAEERGRWPGMRKARRLACVAERMVAGSKNLAHG